MFYYFIPRCRVDGNVTFRSTDAAPVAKGQGWYDHEFGGPHAPTASEAKAAAAAPPAKEPERVDVAWNWAAVQLDNGDGADGVRARARRRREGPRRSGPSHIDAGRLSPRLHDAVVHAGLDRGARRARSTTIRRRWTLSGAGAGIELGDRRGLRRSGVHHLHLQAGLLGGALPGRAAAVGGKPVHGLGYVERSGFEPVRDLDEFFAAVGEEVRKSVGGADAARADVRRRCASLIAAEERDHYMDGVDKQQIARTLVRAASARSPIAAASRGARTRRSPAATWSAATRASSCSGWRSPELMHVGLAHRRRRAGQVDGAPRRAGRAPHLRRAARHQRRHGRPTSSRSGFCARASCRRATSCACYDLYFEAMRAGHAGQAHRSRRPRRAAAGASSRSATRASSSARCCATHRLKAAAPAAALARMGAVAGGGTDAQIEAVGRFFEALGLAFQIIDDVLNLRGFKGDLKARGEDITNGNDHAAGGQGDGAARRRRGASAGRRRWHRSRPIRSSSRAWSRSWSRSARCRRAPTRRASWSRRPGARPIRCLPDSIPKVMLRAFGWYILERHY